MTKKYLKPLGLILALALTASSCKQLARLATRTANEAVENATSDDNSKVDYDHNNGIIGTDFESLNGAIDDLFEKAKLQRADVELSDIDAYYSKGTNTRLMIDVVSAADKNKMERCEWSTNSGIEVSELTLSDDDNNLVTKYEQFAGHLFKFSAIEATLKVVPQALKDALERSGYGADGYVAHWDIRRKDSGNFEISVRVQHTSSITMTKSTHYDAQGKFLRD